MAETDSRKRTAVVFIHGQGEQRPMDSVRELARTMWDAQAKGRWSWITPDARFELADIGRVKAISEDGKLVDFFEFYYAHKLEGNRTDQAVGFIARLIARPRDEAPPNLLPVRQWVLRFPEFAAITTAVFMFAVAALLGREPIEAAGGPIWAHASAAFNVISRGIEWAAVGAVALGLAVLVFNEAFGGRMRKPRTVDPRGIAGRSGRGSVMARVYVLIGALLLAMLVLVMGRQGPTLEAHDVALPICC